MLTGRLKEIQGIVTSGSLKRIELTAREKELTEQVESVQTLSEIISKSQTLVQHVAQQTQNKIRLRITDIVQSAVEYPFGDEYEFYLEFESKRGRTEARLFLKDEFNNEFSPMDANGGGLVDIISFALRIAIWSIDHQVNGVDSVIVLDEPFKFLSNGIKPLGAEMLRKLSEELKLQILMVTHEDTLMDIADRVFVVTKDDKTKRSSVEIME
jgi:DNA repair exonuclease SbcCD ATPase subunit